MLGQRVSLFFCMQGLEAVPCSSGVETTTVQTVWGYGRLE